MTQPECDALRELLPVHVRGLLTQAEAHRLQQHLESCAACSGALREERVLSELLTRLPAHGAPDRLTRTLTQQVTQAMADAKPTVRPKRAWGLGLTALSLAAAALLGFALRDHTANSPLQREALNDHLRVLYAQNPVEIANTGLHQVKPWFTGRVDFAPDITFVGDEEFPMLGGAVSYFMDRKAASFVFKRRLHTISLFVFRSEGLEWPRDETRALGGARVELSTLDGFNMVFWQARGLGHALVSDVSQDELVRLASKLLQ